MAIDRQPGADYRARRLALAKAMHGGVALLFAAVESEGPSAIYGFRQDNDFYYLTGWSEPGAALLVAPAEEATPGAPGRPYTEILFLPARNRSGERWTGAKLGADDPAAASVTGFDRVEELDRMHGELVKLMRPRMTVYTAMAESPETTASTIPLEWLKRGNAFPTYVSFTNIQDRVAELRKHKDRGEIERIRQATEASMKAHREEMKAMRPGLMEYQIAALMQYTFAEAGCERPAYAPIVGSGVNSTVLHYSLNSRRIRDGELVVIDVAGEYAMYASDITRTLPANGRFTPRQREIYDIVLGAQRAAMAAARPGKTLAGRGAESLYQVAFDYINTHGKDLHGQPLGQYFIHGLGHRVGLEVHDAGEGPLAAGDVFTIEPGIYIPEENLGVRIEDIVMLDDNGELLNLTGGLAHTADEIEHAMRH